MELTIKHTSQYTGSIMIDNEIIVNLSQSFDEDGHMNGGTALYIQNKDKYYANLQECRAKEDEFKAEMRKIEDQSVVSKDDEDSNTTEDVEENESEE